MDISQFPKPIPIQPEKRHVNAVVQAILISPRYRLVSNAVDFLSIFRDLRRVLLIIGIVFIFLGAMRDRVGIVSGTLASGNEILDLVPGHVREKSFEIV